MPKGSEMIKMSKGGIRVKSMRKSQGTKVAEL